MPEDPLVLLPELEYNVSEAHAGIRTIVSALGSDRLPTLMQACGDASNLAVINATIHSVGKCQELSSSRLSFNGEESDGKAGSHLLFLCWQRKA